MRPESPTRTPARASYWPAYAPTSAQSPVAVFDSGLGGLTVVRALRRILPGEEVVYFGDTARVPYGGKSAEAVTRFAREICDFLLHLHPKCIIAACNTVSATAIGPLKDALPVPLLGVVESTAQLAVESTTSGIVAVLGTEATIASGAFERAIRELDPGIRVVQQSCPLFVPLVEEGRSSDDPIVKLAIQDYLEPVRRLRPDVVLQACTHYPLLSPALQKYFGEQTRLVDSGDAVSHAVARLLTETELLSSARQGGVQCYVSDFPQRFSVIGSRFLGESLPRVIRTCADGWVHSRNTPNPAASA